MTALVLADKKGVAYIRPLGQIYDLDYYYRDRCL
jgi:hypothetical protein